MGKAIIEKTQNFIKNNKIYLFIDMCNLLKSATSIMTP